MLEIENNTALKELYFWQRDRLESFITWPFNATKRCNVSKMAEAGFYWSGTPTEPDSATCFACGKVLDGWEENDDPWDEHRQHAPQCVFVKIGKPEEMLTVGELYDLVEIFAKKMVEKKYQAFKKAVTEEFDSQRKVFAKNLRM